MLMFESLKRFRLWLCFFLYNQPGFRVVHKIAIRRTTWDKDVPPFFDVRNWSSRHTRLIEPLTWEDNSLIKWDSRQGIKWHHKGVPLSCPLLRLNWISTSHKRISWIPVAVYNKGSQNGTDMLNVLKCDATVQGIGGNRSIHQQYPLYWITT